MNRPCLLALIAAAFGAGACRSLPVNSKDPACGPCSHYVGRPGASACALQLPAVLPPPSGGYRHLVLEGGGVKGAAYAGALKVLDQNQLLGKVDGVAGTSAGAITALLLALGYSAQEVMDVLLDLDFSRFKDGRELADVDRLFTRYGWYKGDFALCLFECLVEKKTGDRRTTFAQLEERRRAQPEAGFRELRVFGTDVNAHAWVEFSARTHPEVALADAARISMSIPLFFAAREFQGHVFVDGGVLINYPIGAFDGEGEPQRTLGLHLGTQPTVGRVEGFVSYTEQTFATLLDSQVDDLCAAPSDVRRSVFINPLGIKATDFDLTLEQKCALAREGVKATDAYLRQGPPQSCPAWFARPPQD